MEQCVSLARALGERVGRELAIPVYLYERAATRPSRENLADVRRGEFEGLREAIRADPDRAPDFGPLELHPAAGAIAIGARPFLVAYNIYLGPATNLAVAKEVAKAVRGSSGGLRYVKALGLEVDGQAQVSMNLVDTDRTPLHRAYDAVRTEAAAHGVSPTWSEIVGLVPERVLVDTATRSVQLRGFSPDQLLERRVRAAVAGGPSVADFVRSVSAPTPTPGGGSVAALVGALAAALSQMVAGLTIGRPKYAPADAAMRQIAASASALSAKLVALADRDADAYQAVLTATKLPKVPSRAATSSHHSRADSCVRDPTRDGTGVRHDRRVGSDCGGNWQSQCSLRRRRVRITGRSRRARCCVQRADQRRGHGRPGGRTCPGRRGPATGGRGNAGGRTRDRRGRKTTVAFGD